MKNTVSPWQEEPYNPLSLTLVVFFSTIFMLDPRSYRRPVNLKSEVPVDESDGRQGKIVFLLFQGRYCSWTLSDSLQMVYKNQESQTTQKVSKLDKGNLAAHPKDTLGQDKKKDDAGL